MNHLPEAFLQRVEGQLGSELPAFLHAMDDAPCRGIRFHPLRKLPADLLREDRIAPIPWEKNGWLLRRESNAGRVIFHEAGAYYLQEPGAMIPARVMNAQPGEILLDLCAAPGGKSTQMGIDMAGEGILVCNEPVPKRAQVLSRNLERMGIPNAVVTCAYPDQLARKWPEGFDGVMVDAPCSGEGMFRRQPETRQEWSAERARGCAQRQVDILDAAAGMVRPGGRLVYATCTWNPEENEEQVNAFVRRHPEFALAAFDLPGVHAPEGMFTCWPQRMAGEGQFAALLRKSGNGAAHLPAGKLLRMSREEQAAFSGFGDGLPMPTGRLGTTLIHLPLLPDLQGIRTLRVGLHLGEIRGKTFIPDHAAALHFTPPAASCMDLGPEEAGLYLAGESLPGEAAGWVLMRYEGLVLGWGKGSEGRIRNHYPKGLRNARLRAEEEDAP